MVRYDGQTTGGGYHDLTSIADVSFYSFIRPYMTSFYFISRMFHVFLKVHGLRVNRNTPGMDGFDYNVIGTDDHLNDIMLACEEHGVIGLDYIATVMRDLRGLRHGNLYHQ